ncbi:MAG: HNH endonuclease [Anaerolineae bacterium]
MNMNNILSEMHGIMDRLRKAESEGTTRREQVRLIVQLRHLVDLCGKALYPEYKSARARLLAYMQEHVGQPIHSTELAAVAGISEYARRIRELRVEFGYDILTMEDDPNLGANEYLLTSIEPDQARASRWELANTIRNRKDLNASERILEFLKANVGCPVTSDELQYVAKIKEFGRRIRDLRTEGGWIIHSGVLGRPDLRPTQYVLESLEQTMPHERSIPESVAKKVYERDNYQCVECGWSKASADPTDSPRYLQLHHRVPHADKGPNTVDNLEVRCNICHKQAHTTQ